MRLTYRVASVLLFGIIGFAALGWVPLTPPARGDTPVSGPIGSGTWTLAQSPIWIEGDTFLTAGSTLTIEAGVQVLFNGSFRLMINGTLYANGDSLLGFINFTSNQSSPAPGDYVGIYINDPPGAGVGHAYLNYCNFSYAYRAVEFSTDDNWVRNSVFWNNENGTVADAAFFNSPRGFLLENSTFARNNNSFYVEGLEYSFLANNTFDGNTHGIVGPVPFPGLPAPLGTPAWVTNGVNITNNTFSRTNGSAVVISQPILFPGGGNVVFGNTVSTSVAGVGTVFSSNDLLQDNLFVDTESEVALAFSAGTTIFNNRFFNASGGGILALESNNLTLVQNRFVNVTGGLGLLGFGFVQDNRDNLVSGNNFTLGGGGVSDLAGINNAVTNNEFWQTGGGIALLQDFDPLVTGNWINDSFAGISATQVEFGLIGGNSLSGTLSNGISLGFTNNTLTTFNTVVNTGLTAIQVTGGIGNTIDTNTIVQAESGVAMGQTLNASVLSNSVEGSVSSGISVTDSTNVTLTLNVLNDSGTGIAISGGGLHPVLSNTMRNTSLGFFLTGSSGNQIDQLIVDNDVAYPSQNGVLINAADGNVFSNIQVDGNRQNGFTVSASDGNLVTGLQSNDNWGSGFVATILSTGNDIAQSSFIGNQNFSAAFLATYGNVLRESLLSGGSSGVLALAASDLIENSTIVGTVIYDFYLDSNSHMTSLNSTFNKTKTAYNDSLSDLSVEWYEEVLVMDSSLAPLSGATPYVYDALGGLVYDGSVSGATDPNGKVSWLIDVEYVENSAGRTYHTPHETRAEWMGKWGSNTTSIDVSKIVEVIIDIVSPAIISTAANPTPQEVHFPVNLTATTTDNVAVVEVRVNITDPASGSANLTMAPSAVPNEYYLEQTYDLYLGDYDYLVWAGDANGNWMSSILGAFFTIQDTTPPTITAPTALPATQVTESPVNVSAFVSDNFQLDTVTVNITDPNSVIFGPYPMALDPLYGRYYDERIWTLPGTYGYEIRATDTSGQAAKFLGNFILQDPAGPLVGAVVAAPDPQEVHGSVNITAIITDDVDVGLVFVAIVDPSGTTLNTTMNWTGSTYYFLETYDLYLGTYSVTLWATDTSGNPAYGFTTFQIQDTTPPTLPGITALPAPQEVDKPVNLSGEAEDNYLIDEVQGIVTGPDGVIHGPYLLRLDPSTSRHYLNASWGKPGRYNYSLLVKDVAGNTQTYLGNFTVLDRTPPVILHAPILPAQEDEAIELEAIVTDNVAVSKVYLRYVDTAGEVHNESLGLSGDSFSIVLPAQEAGDLEYYFYALDSSGNGRRSTSYVLVVESNLGSLEGTVTGLDGLNVGGAQVRILASNGTVVATVTTNATDGGFLVPDLPPGTYTVQVSKSGFLSVNRTGVVVKAGDSTNLGAILLTAPSGPTQEGFTAREWGLLAGLLVLAVLTLLMFLLFFRKKRKIEEPPGPSEQTRSTPKPPLPPPPGGA